MSRQSIISELLTRLIALEEAHTGETSFSGFMLEKETFTLTAEELKSWQKMQKNFLFRMKHDAKRHTPAVHGEGEALGPAGNPPWEEIMTSLDARQFRVCLTNDGRWRPEPAARIYGYFIACRVLHACLAPGAEFPAPGEKNCKQLLR